MPRGTKVSTHFLWLETPVTPALDAPRGQDLKSDPPRRTNTSPKANSCADALFCPSVFLRTS